MNPITIFDRLTDALGALLIRMIQWVGIMIKQVTTLPAGFQVILAVGTMGVMGICFLWMRQAMGDAASISKNVRKAGDGYRKAREELPFRDRRKAWGYLMGLAFLIGLLILATLVFQALRAPTSPGY